MRLWNKLYELFWKIHCFKVRRISNSTNGSSLKQCIFQRKVRRAYSIGAYFYVEKIKLELYQKWSWSRPFSVKSPHTYFQTPTHEISLFASLNTLNDFFLYKTQKQPIMSLSGKFLML